ncbi:hypothetical protein Bbelb_210400 [Branchiostoma belcheri]|nr:hypothetical protein Bbelb_210400 [Branchiostoma belcheri]
MPPDPPTLLAPLALDSRFCARSLRLRARTSFPVNFRKLRAPFQNPKLKTCKLADVDSDSPLFVDALGDQGRFVAGGFVREFCAPHVVFKKLRSTKTLAVLELLPSSCYTSHYLPSDRLPTSCRNDFVCGCTILYDCVTTCNAAKISLALLPNTPDVLILFV